MEGWGGVFVALVLLRWGVRLSVSLVLLGCGVGGSGFRTVLLSVPCLIFRFGGVNLWLHYRERSMERSGTPGGLSRPAKSGPVQSMKRSGFSFLD